jgi:hypothetical protein
MLALNFGWLVAWQDAPLLSWQITSSHGQVISWVALDDRDLVNEIGGKELVGHFVRTHMSSGLNAAKADMAIEILNAFDQPSPYKDVADVVVAAVHEAGSDFKHDGLSKAGAELVRRAAEEKAAAVKVAKAAEAKAPAEAATAPAADGDGDKSEGGAATETSSGSPKLLGGGVTGGAQSSTARLLGIPRWQAAEAASGTGR